jgi:hypothetical protein
MTIEIKEHDGIFLSHSHEQVFAVQGGVSTTPVTLLPVSIVAIHGHKYHGCSNPTKEEHPVGADDSLVHGTESTVRKSETVGERCLYLTYKLSAEARARTGVGGTFVQPLRLPRLATRLELHGPGTFQTDKGEVYGVRIEFNEVGREYRHRRTVKLPHPVSNVQLLDRQPDERYRAAA